MKSALPLLMCSFVLSGCAVRNTANSQSPAPSNTKLEEAIKKESNATDTVETRLLVRQKTVEYLKNVRPSYQIKGISLSSLQGNVYVIGLDVDSDKGRKTFDIIARLYVANSGDTYWKIEALTQQRSDALLGKTLDGTDEGDSEPPDEQ